MKQDAEFQLGILAYGSLINDPGSEIEPLIIERIECETPFNVEFARLSKSRSYAPTLVPVTSNGKKVKAVIFVLKNKIPISMAESILWRREIHLVGSAREYNRPLKPNENSVLVEHLTNFHGVHTVLYTSIRQNMGIFCKADLLAHFAIKSILSSAGDQGKDGIRYLQAAHNNGIVTALSESYIEEVLKQTGTKTLSEAIIKLDSARPQHLEEEKELSDFEQEVVEITDLICEYGVVKTFGNNEDIASISFLNLSAEAKSNFMVNCHDGFKQAQSRIVQLMLSLQGKLSQIKADLKEANRSKNKSEVSKLKYQKQKIEFKENVVRHLADTIAFQMLRGQLHVMRRFYQEVEGSTMLQNSNLESVLAVAKEINNNPKNIALITDLTGYIQSGDLLCLIDGRLVIGEVKAGTKNLQILEILKEVEEVGQTLDQIREKYNLDKHSFKQLKRNLRQQEVMGMISNILSNDTGIDPLTNEPFMFLTPDEAPPRYYDELSVQMEHLDRSNMLSYNLIDKCLHIGMYKGPFRFLGKNILKEMSRVDKQEYLFMDMQNIIQSINKPIFFLPFEKSFIFDILFGRIKILFILNLDEYLNLYPQFGFGAEWGTRKETADAISIIKGRMGGLFVKNNRGIKIKVNDTNKLWIFSGTFLKIFFDQIYPSYTAYSTKYYLELKPGESKGTKKGS